MPRISLTPTWENRELASNDTHCSDYLQYLSRRVSWYLLHVTAWFMSEETKCGRDTPGTPMLVTRDGLLAQWQHVCLENIHRIWYSTIAQLKCLKVNILVSCNLVRYAHRDIERSWGTSFASIENPCRKLSDSFSNIIVLFSPKPGQTMKPLVVRRPLYNVITYLLFKCQRLGSRNFRNFLIK